MQHQFYLTIAKSGKGEYADRGSRFIGYAFEVDNKALFKTRLQTIAALHEKASHYCYAYRIGTSGQDWRCTDNGEPSGTAGRPILGQLDSFNVVNAAVVVVRYFGGTLLGVPGLINAYRAAAQLALQQAHIEERPLLQRMQLEFDYTVQHDVFRLVKEYGLTIEKTEQGLFFQLTVGVPVLLVPAVQAAFASLSGLQLFIISS
jgi:uncharacterized YigZ family protein